MIKKLVVTAFSLAFTLACFDAARAALDACEDVCNEEVNCSTGCSEYRSYSEVATTCGAGGCACKSKPEEEDEDPLIAAMFLLAEESLSSADGECNEFRWWALFDREYQYFFDAPIDQPPLMPADESPCGQPGFACLVQTSIVRQPVYDSRGKLCEYFPENGEQVCRTWYRGVCPVGQTPSNRVCRDVEAIETRCPYCGEDQTPPPGIWVATPKDVPTREDIQQDIDKAKMYDQLGNGLAAQELRQRALDKAAHRWGFDFGLAKLTYDPYLQSLGTIDPGADIIYIGKQAFYNASTLGATIGHERMHIKFRRDHPNDHKNFRNRDEARAYGWMLKYKGELGLSQGDIDRLGLWRSYNYYVEQSGQCPNWNEFRFPGP